MFQYLQGGSDISGTLSKFRRRIKNQLVYQLFRAGLSQLFVEAETKTNRHIPAKHCCGSMTFGVDPDPDPLMIPCLWLMDPDPSIFIIDLQDANKKKFKKSFSAYYHTFWMYSGRGKFMPLPLKSKLLETPGSLVTDDIKMFPLWIWTLNLQASLMVQYELFRICNYMTKVNKLSVPIFLKKKEILPLMGAKILFFNWREMLFNGLRWVWSEK